MKKKIIFVTEALWIGGIETALVNLLNRLDYEKYDVTCLILRNDQTMAPRLPEQVRLLVADRHDAVSFREAYRWPRLYHLTEESANPSRLHRAMMWAVPAIKWLENRLYIRYIRAHLKDEHFDTCVIYSDRTAEAAVCAINADRFLMFYHNADIGKAYHDVYGYRKSEKIIAVSESQCEKLKRLRSAFAHKMVAIPNYVDVDAVMKKASQPVAYPLFQEPGIHLVSCGRLAHQKGFDIAVEACAQLVKMGYSNLHWYILGVGALRADLKELAKQHGVEDHFHLIGARNNPFPYMTQADLYVQPSRTEGYSLSILEARVLTCPMVATYGAAGEQLEHGVNGTLCDANVKSLTEAIDRHLQDPSLSESYREALKNFSFEKANRDILMRIEELL